MSYNLSVRSNQSIKKAERRDTTRHRLKAGRPPRRRPGRPKVAETRDRLIDAALQTLRTHGFAGTTARAIAAGGGLNQALIFYHFGSVDQLLLAALEATSQRRLRRYRSALQKVTTVSEAVRLMARLYEEDLQVGHVTAVQEMVAGASSVPRLRGEVVARMEPWVAFAEEIIARLIDRSALKSALPVRDLAFGAVALYFGIETVTNLEGSPERADHLFRTARRLTPILDAVLAQAAWTGRRDE
jgi:AcrR family transcriptional regulator